MNKPKQEPHDHVDALSDCECWEGDDHFVSFWAWVLGLVCVLGVALWVCWPWRAEAAGVSDHDAIVSIIGEALHDDDSMYAMACALNNRIRIRGDLKGVYGFKADTGHIGPKLWQRASKAWFTAQAGPDVTAGADHWLSDWDLEHCKPERMTWRHGMIETAYIGQTHFYRSRK